MLHICVTELGWHWFLSHVRQAIARTNVGLLLIGLPGTNFSKIQIGGFIISIQENAFEIVACQNGSHFVQGEMS